MVDNNLLSYVKSDLGRSIHPYDSENPVEEETAEELFEDFSYSTDLENFDALILHGAPSEEEDELRHDLFEKAAFYLQASGKNTRIFAPEKFRENIESSEVIHSKSVNYIDPEITEDELSQTYREFNGEGRIHITSDYHAEGVDHLSSKFDEDDFVVLSADTGNEKFPSESYTQILPGGKLASKLPLNWRFWAEGKEAGRKLTDWKRGPRF